MTKEPKTILKNNRHNNSTLNSHGHFMCVGVILCVIMLLMIVAYCIIGVLYLSSEFKIWKECNNTNLLWPWIMVSMISIVNIYNIRPLNQFKNKIFFWLSFVYEILLIIWGGIELFLRCYQCKEIILSPLWDFGLTTFIIQCLLITIFFKIIWDEFKIKKSNNIKDEKIKDKKIKFVSFSPSVSLNSFGDNPLSEI